jgi:hypothetical protein
MALRREILSYLGTGAIGGIIGYIARARGLLGLKSMEGTRTPPEDEDQPGENQDQSSEDSDTETVVIDDFESGSLSSNWIDAFDTSNVGTDAGRSNFTVQSSTAPEGQFALKGNHDEFSEGGSSITRNDFQIETEEATISFYANLGETYTGNGRPNSVEFRSDSAEDNIVVRVTQRPDRAAANSGYIAHESLNSSGLVELRNISFQEQQIGEVAINSEVVDTNVDFASDSEINNISQVKVGQGHWRQSYDIIVDNIQYTS